MTRSSKHKAAESAGRSLGHAAPTKRRKGTPAQPRPAHAKGGPQPASAKKLAPGSPVKVSARGFKRRASSQYVLRLYVTGTTPRSIRAIENVRRICDEHLAGRYRLEVIDLYQRAPLAAGEQILAAPTLIKALPPPLRRLIGDMSDTGRVLVGLNLIQHDPAGSDTAPGA